jgi:carbonic anhydrase/acetyltransferase-like protein (isoleucine patch superfamily)
MIRALGEMKPRIVESAFVSEGNNVTIAHGSMIHCARIGNDVLIGMHAALEDQSEIEDFCIIA